MEVPDGEVKNFYLSSLSCSCLKDVSILLQSGSAIVPIDNDQEVQIKSYSKEDLSEGRSERSSDLTYRKEIQGYHRM